MRLRGSSFGGRGGAGCASGSFITNLPPVAYDDWYITYQGSQLNVPASGVLANDCDPNLNSITAYRTFGPFYGSLTLNPNGSFQYTPNPGFSGYDDFWYRAFDGQLYSVDEAAVDIHVLGADIDTDSDNNGAVNLSATEESIEIADPGKILMYNDDDDNSNGVPTGGDVEIDRTNLGVTHTTIDDNAVVRSTLKTAFESRVLR
ncbi:MAG: Ig-like domain-containing protein [Pirellulales bacterium]